jgi:mannosyltransferase OCH1-like enzyme
MITEKNLVINGLWIGTELSYLEQLTLHSFTHHGHHFRLWSYGGLVAEIPENVSIMDANEIILEKDVFRYNNTNQFGHGKGSVAGFSDIFRYKILYEKGGWWVDMDVTCLKPFNSEQPYYFRAHHELNVVGNVMKCPKHSPLMLKCYETAIGRVTEQNRDWHLPIRILNEQILVFGLDKYTISGDSPPDQWNVVRKWLFSRKKMPEHYKFVHWLNEVWRTKNIDSKSLLPSTYFGQLLNQYRISQKKEKRLKAYIQAIRYRWF